MYFAMKCAFNEIAQIRRYESNHAWWENVGRPLEIDIEAPGPGGWK